MGVSNPNTPPLCGLHICNFFRRKCYHGYQKAVGPVAPAADKKKALAAALGSDRKQFGKGSVMRLGENTGNESSNTSRPARSVWISHSASAVCRAAESLRSTDRNPPVRPRLRCTALQRRRSWAARLRLSTPSTRSTRFTPRHSALTLTACWSPSRTPVSRVWTLRKRLCARARSTSWLSTRLPR